MPFFDLLHHIVPPPSQKLAMLVLRLLAKDTAQVVQIAAIALRTYFEDPDGGYNALPVVIFRVAVNPSSVTSALNLTTPNDDPLQSDPRACIHPTDNMVQIDVVIPNSQPALSVNSASAGSSFPLGGVPLGVTNISVFGIIVILTPSIVPVDEGSYLLQPSGANLTLAGYLNQSSVYDKDYNTLFKSFNLAITYDSAQVPNVATVAILDLVAGVKISSSQVDGSNNRVAVSGITSYDGAWGGGGVYAFGY
ncbi:hypothetical protein BD410DRAFT_842289 [Rickenella mellea]|uniref:Uncharacterized protein n=1 Tax=Rickenella mellea TaxID=50990 RepID=A0A4Y7PUW1_9AGAM|nr:hypothetical protein BD410DRAFT_842289 [Rickenella mellea]